MNSLTVARATVFGGTGFVGRHIVRRLAKRGIVVRVAVRRPDEAWFLKPMGAVGQIVPVYGDVADEKAVAAAVDGADWVIDAVGYWRETRKRRFDDVHGRGVRHVARHAAATGARGLVLMSGIGVSAKGETAYVRSRAAGEAEAREAFAKTIVLRPSAIFGPGDSLFTAIAGAARYAPVYPLIGGDTRMQPVYVGDVADAAVAALDDREAAGATFELGGPVIYTHRELVELTLRVCNRRRVLLDLPFWVADLLARIGSLVPGAPLTPSMVELLKHDNVVDPKLPGLDRLGVHPTAAESILPTYLDRFRRGGRWRQARLA